jgi:DNA-binding MarR family transcriptional regulator
MELIALMSRRSGSLASLRGANQERVIDALRERGVASRAELARVTDLSRSTASTIVTDLLDAGLAGERNGQPDDEAQTGRPPLSAPAVPP